MKLEYISSGVGAAQFHAMRWTLAISAAQSQVEGGRAASAELCQVYWYPLYLFVRLRGRSPHDAQDLTQGFFLHLVKYRALTHVDQLKGKFRSFLVASFQNHLSVEAHRARSLKRGGKCEFVSLDLKSAENRYRLEPANHLIFDVRWAVTLLGRAITLLGNEYAAQGKSSICEILKVFLRIGDAKGSPPYEEAAKVHCVGVGAVKTLIHRLRKRYSAHLRQEVGRTVSDPAEIDGEIHALCDALIAAEGQIVP